MRDINAELDAETYRTALARKRNRVPKLADMANLIEERIRNNRKASPLLVREWRGLYEQIARELGQWSDKLELSGELDVRRIDIREVVLVLPPVEEQPKQAAPTPTPKAIEAEWREAGPEVPALPPAPPNAYTTEHLSLEEMAAIRERRDQDDWG